MILQTGKSTAVIDLHAHILPGIDDGAPDEKETCRMLERCREQGVDTVAATSHFHPDEAAYREAFQKASQLASKYGVQLLKGTEYSLSSAGGQEKLSRTIHGGKYFLLDLETIWVSPALENKLNSFPYFILLAHPERLWESKTALKNAEILSGVWRLGFQMNCGSFLGQYGKETERTAWKLLEAGYCSVIASDAHRTAGIRLQECRNLLSKYFPEESLECWFETNPGRIIHSAPALKVSVRLTWQDRLRRMLRY